jgi:alpha-beta hydrolase superfamily lysophospholipase
MRYAEFAWRSKDGTRMFGCEWKPTDKKQIKAVIGIVHGMGEHTGFYTHVAESFTAEGYAVLSFDQRGHGLTEGKRGDSPHYGALLESVDLLLAEMNRRHPELPKFLYGHSMGGNVTLNHILRQKPELTGAVVVGPWLKLVFKPPPLSDLIGWIVERTSPRDTNVYPLAAKRGTSDPEMIRRFVEDPLRHGRITSRFFLGVQLAGLWALAHAGELTVPLLLLHGGDDRITSIKASRQFAIRAGTLCTFREWPGFRHDLHNELGRKEVFDFVLRWLNDLST